MTLDRLPYASSDTESSLCFYFFHMGIIGWLVMDPNIDTQRNFMWAFFFLDDFYPPRFLVVSSNRCPRVITGVVHHFNNGHEPLTTKKGSFCINFGR